MIDFTSRHTRYVDFSGGEDYSDCEPDTLAGWDEATVICSDTLDLVSSWGELLEEPSPRQYYHMPVIDIDVPAHLLQSSTPGHSHLYIDHKVKWEDYLELLKAMAKCGIVEQGYVWAAEARQWTAVRLPWVSKGNPKEGNQES